MFRLGLFENPYVDPDAAQAIAEDREIQALADSAHRRSLVLLRNDRGLLPLTADDDAPVRLYVEAFTSDDPAGTTTRIAGEVAGALEDESGIAVVGSPEDATHALLWLRPMISLLNDRPDTALSLALDEQTGIDVDRVLALEARLPSVVAVDFANPWLLDRVAPGAAAVVGTFSALTDALVDLVRGAVSPTGRLPFTVPADEAAVLGKHSDIPGADEPEGYAYADATGARYTFGYGRTEF
jgi:beta-glucosidase